MGLFKKEHGVDILDLTLLQRKGLLKVPALPQRGADILDLTLPHPAQQPLSSVLSQPHSQASFFDTPQPSPSSGTAHDSTTPIADNPFGMLDTLAGAASAAPQSAATGVSTGVDTAAFNALKIKLDDMEFRLDRLVEKFSLLDERLQAGGSVH